MVNLVCRKPPQFPKSMARIWKDIHHFSNDAMSWKWCFKQKISSWVINGLDFPAKHCDKKANDAALVVLASNCIRLETRDFFFRIGKIGDQNRTIDALVIARANYLKQKWSNQRPRSSSLHSLCFPYIPSTRKKKKRPPATIAKSTTTKARWKDPGIWAMRTSKRGRLWNRWGAWRKLKDSPFQRRVSLSQTHEKDGLIWAHVTFNMFI